MARAGDPPVLLVKWYDFSKGLLERVESFPKSQRFVFGQRLADRSLAILETLVDAAWSPPGPRKAGCSRARTGSSRCCAGCSGWRRRAAS